MNTADLLILLVKHGTEIRATETTRNIDYAAMFMELDVTELRAMLDKHGRVDTDTCVCITWEGGVK